MQCDEAMLRDYLVEGVEDPRLNVQSILTRHFLIEALFDVRDAALMEHELRFAVFMNWLLALVKQSGGLEDFPAILHALNHKSDNAEGLLVPHFVSEIFAVLPAVQGKIIIPNYIGDALTASDETANNRSVPDEASRAVFQELWRRKLQRRRPAKVSVLEPACGSANDYRFIDAFGLARFLDYCGFDLCEKNVRNAKTMFPRTRFAIGNAFAIPAPDKSFDYCFVHDLFEHLSIEAMELAVAEMCRVTRRWFCAGFFNMHECDEHLVQPLDDYHWNRLSMARTRALFERCGFAAQVIHIDTFLRERFDCDETHNKNAYTFVGRAEPSSGRAADFRADCARA